MRQSSRGAPRLRWVWSLALLALVAHQAGCGDDDSTPNNNAQPSAGAGGSSAGGTSSGGVGGSDAGSGGSDAGSGGSSTAGAGGSAGTQSAFSVKPVGGDETASLPLDATPDPDGTAVYFTAVGAEGNGVFKVVLADGAKSELFSGEPLATPVSIAISDDGNTLFLADPAAEGAAEERGRLFSMPASGGPPTALSGADGKAPRGLDVRGDKVYFSGASQGKAGVYTIPTAGGQATALAEGAPLVDPIGLTANAGGEVFVLDAAAAGGPTLFKIAGGQVTALAEGLQVGFPAGVALTLDEKTVMVSALDPNTGKDLVWLVDASSGQLSSFNDTIGQFTEAAGLHRAKNKELFAWADSKANKTGTVFVLQK